MLIGSDAVASAEGPAELGAIGEFFVLDHRILIVPVDANSTDRRAGEIVAGSERFTPAGELHLAGRCFMLLEVSQAERIERRDACEILTGREMQIARMVALGMPNKQIAFKLHISEWTVATHLRRVFTKLSVESRAAMVFRCAFEINRKEPPELPGSGSDTQVCVRPKGARDA